jgi:polyhydroxybutyrate depolymerase
MLRLIFILAFGWLILAVAPRIMRAALNDKEPAVTDLKELLQPGRHRIAMAVDGHERNVIFITPEGFKPGQTLPILFFFHGAGGSAPQAAHTYGWVEKANAENFFVAFPEGLGARSGGEGIFRVWRDGRSTLPMTINDPHFFEVLLDELEAALPIDTHRIYVSGFSNGAGMTFELGSKFSDRIAAIAPVSSQSFAQAETIARPLPVFFITGTADPLIPYHGGAAKLPALFPSRERDYPPVQDSVDQWAKLDGCPPQPQVVSNENGVKVERYGPGRDGSEVIFTTVEGNGHHWPTSPEPLPHAICGPTLDPFSATDRIWDFFVRHPRP